MDRFYIILIAIFCGVNGLGIAYSHLLQEWGIDNIAGMVGNIILVVVTAASYYIGIRGLKNENQHAFVRQVYLSTFFKLLICAIGILIYAYVFRGSLHIGTIILLLGLYIIYTVLETLSLMKAAKTSSN